MNNPIDINIWDDYFEDNHIPKNEIQKTFACVENERYRNNHILCKAILNKIKNIIESELVNVDFDMKLYFFDSTNKYPSLVGTEHEPYLYKRYELGFENLSHKRRLKLLEELNQLNICLNEIKINIYSES
jgi:hypothetical protein